VVLESELIVELTRNLNTKTRKTRNLNGSVEPLEEVPSCTRWTWRRTLEFCPDRISDVLVAQFHFERGEGTCEPESGGVEGRGGAGEEDESEEEVAWMEEEEEEEVGIVDDVMGGPGPEPV
jgi:hypothetical protein